MAQQIAPVSQFEFGGVVTEGHPLRRPPSSASKCDNIRIMPGNWIRLRGGRDLQYRNVAEPNGRFRRFYEVRLANGAGSLWHFAQYDDGAGKSWWQKTMVTGSGYNIFKTEEISRGYGFSEPSLAPICTVRDRVFMGNGYGVRAGTISYPALTQWDGTYVRYVGLDSYCPTSRPAVTATEGSGDSSILYSRRVYVGLWNTVTGHFGNGVYAGEIASLSPGDTPWVGEVTVTGLSGLTSARHSFAVYSPSQEESELKYVFWVTGDGGRVPYLAINEDGTPVAVSYADPGSRSLALNNEFLLDVTQEMPTENFPPRPMSCICYANGRVYGSLAFGNATGEPYVVGPKEICAVVWSAAADDVQDRDFVGVPEESWPRTNRKYTPNGERPLWLAPAQDGTQVLVLTHSGTFLLEETADGLHIWNTVSDISGIWDPGSFTKTQYGYVWLDQRKQIVLLRQGSTRLEVISAPYQKLLSTVATQTPADYLLDPPSKIDRYQIWIGNGKSVIHDFAVGGAYTASGQDYTAAASMLDVSGAVHHIVAREHVWTHEANPFTGLAPAADQNGDATYSEINGDYIGQWNDYGDSSVRKEFREWDVIGDCAPSAQLAGASPVRLSWYGNLGSAESQLQLSPAPQDEVPGCYRAKIENGNKRWLKLRIQLSGHHSDPGATFAQDEPGGDLAPNVYGGVWGIRQTIYGGGQNR